MIKDGCNYTLDIDHSCFSHISLYLKSEISDCVVEVEPVFGFEDENEEQAYDVIIEFDGGCIELWGVPESALVEVTE